MHGATQGIEMSGAKKKLFSSSPGTPAPSSGRKSVVTTPATPCLPPGEFIVAAAPVKATTGGSGTALALAACVVQLSPADMEASSIPLDAFVVIESMEGSLLGVGRVWPHRPLKPGTVRLGWHVYNTHQSVFESSTVHIRLSVLTLPEGAKIAPVASSITCTPYADVSDVLAALSLSFSEANSVIDDSLRPVMPLEDVAMHTVRKLLRGTLCLVGMTVSVRLRGEPRTLKITNATVESRTAVGIGGTGPPTLFSVDSSTNITVTFTPGPASSPDASAPVPSAETTAMSTPLSFGGMDKQAEAIRTMLRLPLQQPELFARMGLQPYR